MGNQTFRVFPTRALFEEWTKGEEEFRSIDVGDNEKEIAYFYTTIEKIVGATGISNVNSLVDMSLDYKHGHKSKSPSVATDRKLKHKLYPYTGGSKDSYIFSDTKKSVSYKSDVNYTRYNQRVIYTLYEHGKVVSPTMEFGFWVSGERTDAYSWYTTAAYFTEVYICCTIYLGSYGIFHLPDGNRAVSTSQGTKYNYPYTVNPPEGYVFDGWSSTEGGSKLSELPIAGLYDTHFYPVWKKGTVTYNVSFKNIDDEDVIKPIQVENGKAISTVINKLPEPEREGYQFGGWLPCKPCCDSFIYNGTSDYQVISGHKYTDKLSVYVQAYIDSWSSLSSTSRQIISCTDNGGWGIGYGADTNGHGAELHASGYKGIDFELASLSGWNSFAITFYNKSFKGYVNDVLDVLKGVQTTTGATITYNATNSILVGAEAGDKAVPQSSNPQYWKGVISNVFIANNDVQLVPITEETKITADTVFYPIWRKITTVTATFKNWDDNVLYTVSVDSGSTPSYKGATPTRPSTAQHDYTFSGWSPTLNNITEDTTYTAQFLETARKYTVTTSSGANGTVSNSVSVNAGGSTTVAIKANTGYVIDTLTVNGEKKTGYSGLSTAEYPISNILSNYTVSVTFKKIVCRVSIEYENCSVADSDRNVEYGDTVTLTIIPDSGDNYYSEAKTIYFDTTQFTMNNERKQFTWTSPAIEGDITIRVVCKRETIVQIRSVKMYYMNEQIGTIDGDGNIHSIPIGQSFNIFVEAT